MPPKHLHLVKGVLVLVLFSLLMACTEPETVTPPQLDPNAKTSLEVSPQRAVIPRGEAIRQTLSIKLDDPSKSVEEAVIFLNAVYGRGPSAVKASPSYFTGYSISNPIFATPISGEQLRAGISTTLSYAINPSAPVGDYTFNIQVYNGNETSPVSVEYSNLINPHNIEFTVR